MASIYRAPTYAGHLRRPEVSSGIVSTSLLVTTLAVASVLPFNNASAFTQPIARPAVNADTSRGVAKTLTDPRPNFVLPHVTPQHPSRRLSVNPDTSKGTAKGLIADSVSPFFVPPHHQVDRLRPVADSSQNTPLTLVSAVVTAPFAVAPQFQIDRTRPVADTSQSAWALLAPVTAQAPFVNPPFVAAATPHRRGMGTLDTSAGAVPPTIAPFAQQPALGLDARRDVRDTSAGTAPGLFPAPVPPFVNPPTLRSDIRPDGRFDVPPNLAVLVPPGPAPFAQYQWPNAIEYRQQYEAKWDGQANPDTIPPAVIVVPAPVGGGEYGKEKRKKRFKVGDKTFTDEAIAATVLLADEPTKAAEAVPVKVKAKKVKTVAQAIEALKAPVVTFDDDEEDIEMLLLSL